jgi:uncharacterized protein YgfB (UPF0149 family)
MTTKNEQTCAQRIQDSLESREEYLFEMMQAMDEGKEFDGYDDAYEAFNDFPLGLSVYKTVKIELSAGGPADYIEAVLDDCGDIVKVSYHFSDWFDHASLRVPEKTVMHEYVERLLDMYSDNGLI